MQGSHAAAAGHAGQLQVLAKVPSHLRLSIRRACFSKGQGWNRNPSLEVKQGRHARGLDHGRNQTNLSRAETPIEQRNVHWQTQLKLAAMTFWNRSHSNSTSPQSAEGSLSSFNSGTMPPSQRFDRSKVRNGFTFVCQNLHRASDSTGLTSAEGARLASLSKQNN